MSLQSLLQRSFDLSNFIFQFNDKAITQVSYSKQKSTCLQISIQRVNDDVRRYIYLLSRSFFFFFFFLSKLIEVIKVIYANHLCDGYLKRDPMKNKWRQLIDIVHLARIHLQNLENAN